MVKTEFTPTSSWRHDFRRLERQFFNIPGGEWNVAVNRPSNELHGNYTEQVHRLHVGWLNDGLLLAEDLERDDFDGDTLLIRLRESIIRPRLERRPRQIALAVPEGASLADLGLGHLA